MIALTFADNNGARHRVVNISVFSSCGDILFALVAKCGKEVATGSLSEDANDGAAPATCNECLGVAHLRGWRPHPASPYYYRGDLAGEHEIANEGELRARWAKEKKKSR